MKFLFFTVPLLLLGCAMNKLFLSPNKMAWSGEQIKYYDPELVQYNYVQLDETMQLEFKDSLGQKSNSYFDASNYFFQNRQGKLMNAWFITPKQAKNTITLFFLHGNSGSIYSQFSLMLPFVKRGYSVFLFDYSGFGYSQGKAKRKFVYTDAKDAFSYFMDNRNDFKTDTVVVYGQSLGGHLAASLSHYFENKIDGIVIEGAFTNHDDIAAELSGMGAFARMTVKEMYSGVDTIAISTCPKLIIHSKEDALIPFYMGEEIYNRSSKPVSFYSIEKPHIRGSFYYADSIDFKIHELLK